MSNSIANLLRAPGDNINEIPVNETEIEKNSPTLRNNSRAVLKKVKGATEGRTNDHHHPSDHNIVSPASPLTETGVGHLPEQPHARYLLPLGLGSHSSS